MRPPTKPIGTIAAMTAKVARIVGLPTSSVASTATLRERRARARTAAAGAGRCSRRPRSRRPRGCRSRRSEPTAVAQLDVLRPVPRDVRRVDLELQKEDVRLAAGDVAEVEEQAPVVASLADRRRLDRVHAHSLRPTRSEDELRVLEVALRGDVEARLHEIAAAHGGRGVDGEDGRRDLRACGGRALAEHVCEPEQRDRRDQREHSTAKPDAGSPESLEVAVPPKRQAVRTSVTARRFPWAWRVNGINGVAAG